MLQDLVVIRVHQASVVLDADSFWLRQNVAGKFHGLFGLPVMDRMVNGNIETLLDPFDDVRHHVIPVGTPGRSWRTR
jgi:hypothetical protein